MAEERERLEAEEKDDVEGQRLREDQTGEDVEGHRRRSFEDQTGDDVEGHRKR